MTTIAEALKQARAELAGHESAGLDAEVLLAHVLHKPRSYLHAWPEKSLSGAQQSTYAALIAQRREGRPVAHLTGLREFWSLPLKVTPDTLIPRPDTEILVEQTLQRLPAGEALRIADLGTGSGAIALALAKERPRWQVYASDKQASCLAVAKCNAERLGIHLAGLLRARWAGAFATASLDAIVANPPYVERGDPLLEEGDVRYEPRSALTAGDDGLDDIRDLAADAGRVLRSAGQLLLEHAPEQTDEIYRILINNNFINIETDPDLAGRARVTSARRARK